MTERVINIRKLAHREIFRSPADMSAIPARTYSTSERAPCDAAGWERP